MPLSRRRRGASRRSCKHPGRQLCLALGLVACSAESAQGGLCAQPIDVGDLVLTEVFADPVGPDAGKEWFELFNASSRALDLRGLTLGHSRADGSRAQVHTMRAVEVPPGGYLVLGNSPADLLPAHVGYGYGVELGEFPNSEPGRLSLACAGQEIDVAQHPRARSGRSRALDGGEGPDAVANDEPARWCEAQTAEYEPGAFGSPGQPNEDCEVALPGRCLEQGALRDTVSPQPGDLVITELMPNPDKVDDALGEWVELRVLRAVDLNGITIDRVGDSAPAQPLAAEACLHVTAPGFAVLARSKDPAVNGGLPRVDAVLPLPLVGGSAQSPGDVHLYAGPLLLDGVRWRRSAAGKALQLDPDFFDAAANDDERVFCDATSPYGAGDRGTPGADNAPCTIVPAPGTCEQQGVIRPIRKPSMGQLVITELLPNPAGLDAEEEWFEVKNTGATAFDLNGLGVDRVGDTARPALVVSASCRSVPAGGHAVLARSADPARNGGLPRVDATYPLSSADAGNLQVLDGEVVLDAVTWTDAPTSASMQLDPAFTSTSGNDLASHFCAAAPPYGAGSNLGTPGAANLPCP
jgi:hypothetical protein